MDGRPFASYRQCQLKTLVIVAAGFPLVADEGERAFASIRDASSISPI